MKSPGNDKLEALKALFPNFLDLHDLIALGCEQTNKYIFSVKQLKGIEHKAYHDTWRVEDYFDPTNENRCFDIPCPTDQFFVDNALIEKEKQYFESMFMIFLFESTIISLNFDNRPFKEKQRNFSTII